MISAALQNKRVVLGVSGSIASYKAADLASKLSQLGIEVDVILTEAAGEFVSALAFQSVTGRPCYVDKDLWGAEGHVLHIGLGKEADLIVIAPATANTLAKLAQGNADNLLTLTALASEAPLMLAPAMDGGMYSHPATQANIKLLEKNGADFVGPASGHLASGQKGEGRLVETAELVGHIRRLLGKTGPLADRKLVVSAGGTRETIDPVRVIANRSSGKQGYALAQAAIDLGAEVTLVSAPTALSAPIGATLIQINTAEEMKAAILKVSKHADALLMAAAVADFRPKRRSTQKIKRAQGIPTINLVENPDILLAVAEARKKSKKPKVVVGFAAESKDLLENAQGKLKAKRLDLIVANDVTAKDAGFNVDTNRVHILDKKGNSEELPLMSKAEVAENVLERVAVLLK
jgi:phosphopantothenoylcysteine decarboxylase/phosphopantothenate--cysteine ligase